MDKVIPGQKFGRRTALSEAAPDRYGHRRWNVRCVCGDETVVFQAELLRGKGDRCRHCSSREFAYRVLVPKNKTHGMHGTAEYRSWGAMVQRCTNEKHKKYKYYGGRGITICPEWLGPGGFDRFIAHIGAKPGKDHTIDRIENSRGYEPGNVRWATRAEQSRNTSSNHMIEFRGERLPLADWAKRLGMPFTTLHGRFQRGWSVEDALTLPVRPWHHKQPPEPSEPSM